MLLFKCFVFKQLDIMLRNRPKCSR